MSQLMLGMAIGMVLGMLTYHFVLRAVVMPRLLQHVRE